MLRVSGSGLGLAEFTPPSVVEKRRKSYEAKGEAVTLNHKPDAFEAFKKSRKAQPGWGQAVEGMSHDQCNHMVNVSCNSSTTIVVAQELEAAEVRAMNLWLFKELHQIPKYSAQAVIMPIHLPWPSLKLYLLKLCNCMASPREKERCGCFEPF